MAEKTWLGVWCIGAALVLGGLADALLRGIPFGINVFLWTLCLVALAAAPLAIRGRSLSGRWMLSAALVFASFLAWRDSEFLAFLNVCAVLACLSLVAWGSADKLRLRGVSGYAFASACVGAFAALGPIPTLFRDIEWDDVSQRGWRKPTFAVLLGVCIAAPLLFVFGMLLAAADAVFADIFSRIFAFDVENFAGHAFLVLFFAWVSAGYLRTFLGKREASDPSIHRPAGISLGGVEVGVALGLLNLLFLAFVAVQARYLFGGAQRVAAGLTYAEYARSGFFELVAVVALVVPVLLAAHWLLAPEGQRVFHILATMTVALILVIMASALWRMNLYYEAFGLTELRFYSTVFMVWIGAILAILTVTVIMRNRRGRFASWTVASGFLAIILLNAMNPDAIIAGANIERMEAGKRFDPYYLTLLSDDAAPTISENLAGISAHDPSDDFPFETAFAEKWKTDTSDWRTWNISRARADGIARSLENPESSNLTAGKPNSG